MAKRTQAKTLGDGYAITQITFGGQFIGMIWIPPQGNYEAWRWYDRRARLFELYADAMKWLKEPHQ